MTNWTLLANPRSLPSWSSNSLSMDATFTSLKCKSKAEPVKQNIVSMNYPWIIHKTIMMAEMRKPYLTISVSSSIIELFCILSILQTRSEGYPLYFLKGKTFIHKLLQLFKLVRWTEDNGEVAIYLDFQYIYVTCYA